MSRVHFKLFMFLCLLAHCAQTCDSLFGQLSPSPDWVQVCHDKAKDYECSPCNCRSLSSRDTAPAQNLLPHLNKLHYDQLILHANRYIMQKAGNKLMQFSLPATNSREEQTFLCR
jgi:hypothetical protein